MTLMILMITLMMTLMMTGTWGQMRELQSPLTGLVATVVQVPSALLIWWLWWWWWCWWINSDDVDDFGHFGDDHLETPSDGQAVIFLTGLLEVFFLKYHFGNCVSQLCPLSSHGDDDDDDDDVGNNDIDGYDFGYRLHCSFTAAHIFLHCLHSLNIKQLMFLSLLLFGLFEYTLYNWWYQYTWTYTLHTHINSYTQSVYHTFLQTNRYN